MILRKKKRTRLFYKYFSNFYDTVNPVFWNEKMRSRAIELFSIQENDTVLDIGCGTGFATEELANKSNEVHAVDITKEQLSKALEKNIDANFILGDADNLPYKDNSFDAVWSSGAIEYFPEPVKTLKEARRVTKKQGKILIVGPNKPKNRFLKAIANSIMLFYNKEEAKEMLKKAGWKDIKNELLSSNIIKDDAIVTIAKKP